MSTDALLEKLNSDPGNKDKFKNPSYLSRKLLPNLVEKEHIIKGRAKDKPQFKGSGWEIVINKAFKSEYPCLLANLNPMPILYKKDYILHLFLHKQSYGVDLYKLYPRKGHETLDKYQIELQFYLDIYESAINLAMEKTKEAEEKGIKLYGKPEKITYRQRFTEEAYGKFISQLPEESRQEYNKVMKEYDEYENDPALDLPEDRAVFPKPAEIFTR